MKQPQSVIYTLLACLAGGVTSYRFLHESYWLAGAISLAVYGVLLVVDALWSRRRNRSATP
jgi:hypothetical protein